MKDATWIDTASPLAPIPRTPGDEWGTQVQVFEEIFLVFLILGTLVGVVVVGYTVYNAYKYRDRGEDGPASGDVERPSLGELPVGEGGGRKLFVSFGISAIIVIGLIAWTYGALLYVEAGPDEAGTDENLDVDVVGFQFGWEFEYPNGHTETNELRVPADRVVTLTITSEDVWHNFGIPELRVKADAIPGQTTETWFVAEETGTYQAWCFELCGIGHSDMVADVVVMEPDEFEQWYDDPEAYEEAEEGEEAEAEDGEDEEAENGGAEEGDEAEAEDGEEADGEEGEDADAEEGAEGDDAEAEDGEETEEEAENGDEAEETTGDEADANEDEEDGADATEDGTGANDETNDENGDTNAALMY